MKTWMKSVFVALTMTFGLSAASITFATSTVGTNEVGEAVYRYVFNLQDVRLALNQELSIIFPAATYQSLSNQVAPPSDFDLDVFQPNQFGGGEDGLYSLMALVDQPSMLGEFRVDFTLVSGKAPTGLAFEVNQLAANGVDILNTVTSGLTEIPEPSTWMLAISGMFFAGLVKVSRQRR